MLKSINPDVDEESNQRNNDLCPGVMGDAFA